MKKIFHKNNINLIAAIAFFIFACSSCSKSHDNHKNTWAKYWLKLNGQVKFVSFSLYNNQDSLVQHKRYEFDREGRPVEEFFNSGIDQIRSTHKYNNNTELANIVFQIRKVSEFRKFKNGILISKNNWIDSVDKNKRLVQQTLISNNRIVSIATLTYNINGNLNSCMHIRSETKDVTTFIYDDNVLKKETFVNYNKDSTQERKIITIYNVKGLKSSIISYFKDNIFESREVYKYDSLDRIIGHKWYNHDSLLFEEHKVNYDEFGLKIDSTSKQYNQMQDSGDFEIYKTEIYKFNKRGEFKESLSKMNSTSIKTVYSYNNEGKLNEEKITYDEGRTIVKYDKMRQKILTQVYNTNDSLIREEKRVIKYDRKGNIIQRTTFKDDILLEILKTQIEYY